jgi:hypothetical protein
LVIRGERASDRDAVLRLQSSVSDRLRAALVPAALTDGEPAVEPLAADPSLRVRTAVAAGLTQWTEPWAIALLARLQSDPHPHVRAAALTPARAAELVADPSLETSWHVLGKAARMAKVPQWKLEPQPRWRPASQPATPAEPLSLPRPATPHVRYLGPERFAVCPLGVSGHYGLPVEGFVRAFEAGSTSYSGSRIIARSRSSSPRLSAADRCEVNGGGHRGGRRAPSPRRRAALRAMKVERLSL